MKRLLLNQASGPRMIVLGPWVPFRPSGRSGPRLPAGMFAVVTKVGFAWGQSDSLFRIYPRPEKGGWQVEQTMGEDWESRWVRKPAGDWFLPASRFSAEELLQMPVLAGE